jgi:hypothetical protein
VYIQVNEEKKLRAHPVLQLVAVATRVSNALGRNHVQFTIHSF